ncbi:hypothetical protein GGR53DRAFT_507214, partial [Hypoxylon sp. FL1150]
MTGARGHVAVAITSCFPGLRAIIQDLRQVIEGAEEDLPPVLHNHIVFIEHYSFNPQPTQGANVYYICRVLH